VSRPRESGIQDLASSPLNGGKHTAKPCVRIDLSTVETDWLVDQGFKTSERRAKVGHENKRGVNARSSRATSCCCSIGIPAAPRAVLAMKMHLRDKAAFGVTFTSSDVGMKNTRQC